MEKNFKIVKQSCSLNRYYKVQKLFLTFRTIFEHNMFSPCSAERRASDKDFHVLYKLFSTVHFFKIIIYFFSSNGDPHIGDDDEESDFVLQITDESQNRDYSLNFKRKHFSVKSLMFFDNYCGLTRNLFPARFWLRRAFC